MYGHIVDPKEILIDGKGDVPPEAKSLIAGLDKYSPRGGEAFAGTQAPKQESAPAPKQENPPAPKPESAPAPKQ